MSLFKLNSKFKPAGDQPKAIKKLVEGVEGGKRDQVLMGVTGSGKTFTMAHVISETNRPAIIMAHNKTLAAQLYSEMKEFFPDNAVEYFVSYYDYYQPEAYIPSKDVYIEKDAQINEQIDLMRHSATRALLERKDVIVVASVSCIYGLGAPEWYLKMIFKVKKGEQVGRNQIMSKLVELQYKRNDIDFKRGAFRARGDVLDIFPSHYEDRAWRINFWGNEIESIHEFDHLTGERTKKLDEITVFANSHYVTPKPTLEQSIKHIRNEMKKRVEWFNAKNMLVESQRIQQRTQFDLEMIMESGSCKGIENYSRYLSGRNPGDPPPTLFEYIPDNAILFVDESHVTVPQVGGMFNGDKARKSNLVDHGFRLPSAMDNRPMRFEEWDALRPRTVFVSATPGEKELNYTDGEFVEQIIRPTGLIDPPCIIRPAQTQVDDLLNECKLTIEKGYRVLVTTLTKKMAEDLADYLKDIKIKAVYLHSDISTLERIEIIHSLRNGECDVLVGVNLLREGLDIPECGLMAILDADKEGFLRSKTSLIQTIGRSARNVDGRVILYADKMTRSLEAALDETDRRRAIQTAHNEKHNITPASIIKALSKSHISDSSKSGANEKKSLKEMQKDLTKMRKEMLKAAADLEFEKAAKLRDEIRMLNKNILDLS